MPFATELKKFGFKKEGTRGVSEATPAKFLAVAPDAELTYKTVLIPDDKLRGVKDRYPSAAGMKEGSGTLGAVDVEASTVGDLIFGGLGSVSSVQPDAANSPTVYKHTFLPLNAVQMPSFTFFVDRGLSKKRYPLTVVKKLAFAGAVDAKATVHTDLLFKSEEPATAFTPVYNSPKPLMFFQTDFRIDGLSDVNVKTWSLNIDNGSIVQRTLNQSRDCKDILSPGRFIINGGFEIYFETETERQKFLDATAAAIDIVITGDVIANNFKNQLEFTMPEVRYTAYPFGNADGLLAAAVAYEAEFNAAAGYVLQAQLTNTITGF